jgi:hypothetical protein
MQRTKMKNKEISTSVTVPKNDLVKWINNGGPFYTKDRKRIMYGETFEAAIEDVPKLFRDSIRPVDPAAVTAIEQRPLQTVKSSFRLQQRTATAFYDVLDDGGKRINEKDLTEPEAKQVLSMLV